jgi:hypothetical protein
MVAIAPTYNSTMITPGKSRCQRAGVPAVVAERVQLVEGLVV